MIRRIWSWVTGTLRTAERSLRASSGYAAAAHLRALSDWVFSSTTSADRDLRSDLIVLRARSRDVVRNTATDTNRAIEAAWNDYGHRGGCPALIPDPVENPAGD
jgi:hypothetical protein